ncbi:hypothetical protein ECH_1039 [Ehrlichia chaffeensis str. Arkansas]|uniref:Uncharacterized protein n=1 Tax=Ehrlichia chaffeensis (strain ATCC CRL-10679 / Arkansas) TaxID=205920 RepID=Q2GFF9_EHRCR|nr:hypothetical protein ECH_1039 [Ehrlichia chaffeensis str. Arkansas]
MLLNFYSTITDTSYLSFSINRFIVFYMVICR